MQSPRRVGQPERRQPSQGSISMVAEMDPVSILFTVWPRGRGRLGCAAG